MKKLFLLLIFCCSLGVTQAIEKEKFTDNFEIIADEGGVEILCNNPRIVNTNGRYTIDGRVVLKKADTPGDMPSEVRSALASCQDFGNVAKIPILQFLVEGASHIKNIKAEEYSTCGCIDPNSNNTIWCAFEGGVLKWYKRTIRLTRFGYPYDDVEEITAAQANEECYEWNNGG